MRVVVFLSPHYGEGTLRFVRQLAALDDVHLVALGGDPVWRVQGEEGLVDDYLRVDNPTDVDEVTEVVAGIASRHPVHAFLTLIEPLQELAAEVRHRLRIPGIRVETARAVRDKAFMKTVFRRHGIPCAAHRRVESWADALAFEREIGLPAILKPVDGQGCLRTYPIHDHDQLEHAFAAIGPSPRDPFIMEELLVAGEGSFDTLTLDGEIRFASVINYSCPPLASTRDRRQKAIYSFKADWRQDPRFAGLEELGRRVIDAVGVDTSITHQEWYRRADGSLLVGEIGARPPGEPLFAIHNFGHDANLFQAWAELNVNHRVVVAAEPKWHVACLGLRAPEPGIITRIHGVDKVCRHLSGLIAALDLPELGSPTQVSGYMGEGKLFCRGTDFAEVMDAAEWAAGEIVFEVG